MHRYHIKNGGQSMRTICVIPARYASTRYPGKPLELIQDKPMIWWVYQQCLKVKEFDEIVVATDDDRILQACERLSMNVLLTSNTHKTGTDRVAEVASRMNCDLIINVQGDEPLIEPEVISQVAQMMIKDPSISVASLMTKIKNPVDITNFTICKVATNNEGDCVYLSRSPIPYPKGAIEFDYYKALGIFGFRPSALKFFSEYGKSIGKTKLEKIEDIELLRFVENGFKVKFAETITNSIAVDTPNDLKKVINYMKSINN